jgi:DNA repair ATPase RecN
MYFYGDAGAIDVDKATQWFTKAAAKGNAVAAASLEMIRQREQHRKDIEYWTTQYDGSDVRTEEYRCTPPRFPAVSKVNEEIDGITAKMKAWEKCYNRYVDHLKDVAPLTRRIPEDIHKLMTKAEAEQAEAHLKQVHEQLTEDAKVSAKLAMADFNVWKSATENYINEHNAILKRSPPGE